MQIDEQTFNTNVNHLRSRLMHLAVNIVGPEYADDAFQDATLKAWQAREKFEGKSSFYTWIYRITFHECLNTLRKLKSKKSSMMTSLTLVDDNGNEFTIDFASNERSVVDKAIALEHLKSADDAFSRLSARHQLALQLRYDFELSGKEIAEALGTSELQARNILTRARQSFRAIKL